MTQLSEMHSPGDAEGVAPQNAPRSGRAAQPTRTLLNFWLDAGLLLAMVCVLWISALLQVVFPPPTTAGGWRLWGLSYNQWRDCQFGALCLAALLALEHLVLHWNWVCGVVATKLLRLTQRPDEASQALYGVAVFIGIVATVVGSIALAMLTVRAPH